MITFFIRTDEDDTILFKKVLKSLDQIPSVLIDYLACLNCHTQVLIESEDKDFSYWVEKTSNSDQLFFDLFYCLIMRSLPYWKCSLICNM